MYKIAILGLFHLCLSAASHAQKIFSEGIIKYDVYVNGGEKPEGLFVLTVKNGFNKRELAMNSGYNNIIIYNHKTGTSTSFNIDEESKYALEMSALELSEKNKRFDKAQFSAINQTKKIAGYNSTASNVQYTNGEAATFFYTTDLLPPNDAFNTMFPGLKGIPLEYEIQSNANVKIKFVASNIEIKSIDPKVFDIPKNYKLVSKDELEKLR